MTTRTSRLLLFVFLLCLTAGIFATDDPIEWRPVSPAELAMDKPVVDPDADAEAIFWEVRLDDKNRKKLYYEHYVRIKIFTERGRETYSKIDIKYLDNTKVENIAARVIRPDGSITSVSASEFFERDIVKTRRFKVKAKSFAVPGVEPGVIIEYQYRERFKGESLAGERLVFQRDLPIQRATYWIRPYKDLTLKPTFFNMPEATLRRDSSDDEYFTTTMTNVPAFKEEPYMAPEDTVRPWAFLEYSGFGSGWGFYGTDMGRGFEYVIKPDKDVKRKAEELISGVTGDEEKVRRIFDYVRKDFRNLSFDKSAAAPDKFKFKRASDLLSRKMGYSPHIDFVFATLLKGIGMSPELVLSGDRSEFFFNPQVSPAHPAFLHSAGVSVMIDGKRRYFNPGTPYLPFGRLLWYEENVYAMVTNGSGYRWTSIDPAEASDSASNRKGKFKLDAEGNLEGNIEITHTGYQASELRRGAYSDEPEKRTEDIRESVSGKYQGADVSNVAIDNFDLPELPLIYSYKIKIPGYTQKTGSRMFLQPGIFESKSRPVFSSSVRKHPIYFRYPWSENDEVEIELPREFELESFAAPADVLEKSKLAEALYSVNYDRNTHTLKYERNFYFGANSKVYFPSGAYPALKSLFDNFHNSDTYSLALKIRAQ